MKTKTCLLSFVARRIFSAGLACAFFAAANAQAGHTLVAHYAFDTTDADNDVQGIDTSGNGYVMNFGAGDGGSGAGGGGIYVVSDAAAGPLAIQFSTGANADGYGVLSWDPTPPALLSTLAGSFTVSCWIKTSQSNLGSPGDPGWVGAGIVAADVAGGAYDTVPIALTGGAIAFTTGGGSGTNDYDDTVTSFDENVNDGNYHFITVTRDQTTGEKCIYIDGQLDNTGSGTTFPLSDVQQIDIGSLGNGGDPNPGDFGFYNGYNGELDDLQFYSGVLNADEVAALYASPGSTAPDIANRPPTTTPNLVAYYTFDDPNNVGADSSGNNNNLDFNGNNGSGGGVTVSDASEAGAGAAYFDGGSCLSYLNAPASVLNTFASSFTLSVWISTTDTSGDNDDPAWLDAGIVAADVPGTANDLVPMALTGNGIGFNTGGPYGDNTLSSDVDIADGSYHHVVVTRDQATGVKQIYVDGSLSSSETDNTVYLNDPVEVGVGAQIDASQSDPNNAIANPSSSAFYEGLMDDMQLYNRVLTPDESAYLDENPGNVITNAAPPAADVAVEFSVYQTTDLTYGGYYTIYPFFTSSGPSGDSTNYILSPNGFFTGTQSANGGNGASSDGVSYDQMMDEITNGYWTLVVGDGSGNEQIFHFRVFVHDLTPAVFESVQILAPLNNAANVPNEPPLQWEGPTNFDYIEASVEADNYAQYFDQYFGDPTVTNWPSPPALLDGTNRFSVTYVSVSQPYLSTTTPVDSFQSPMDSWNYSTDLSTEAIAQFVVGGGAEPVTLVNIGPVAGGIQFSFTSQPGTTNTIQASTNVASTNWMNVTNFVGDGNVWQFVYPTTNPPVEFFRVKTQ